MGTVRNPGTGVFAWSLVASLCLFGCAPDSTNPSPDRSETPSNAIGVRPKTRSDSISEVRQVARALALSLADGGVRTTFFKAFRGSRVAEGKLQIQRFLKGNGRSLARRVEQLNHVGIGELDRALAGLEDLEVYLPNPVDRRNWKGTSDVLVAGFIESDTELRERGTVIAYDTRGRETPISYTAPSTRPIIVLTNVETQYASDGESSPSAIADQSPSPNLIQCPPGDPYCNPCPTCPPPPPPPPDPCLSSSTATNLYICRTFIRDVGQYEGFLRGSPEISMTMFSEPASGTSMALIGCINEDQTGARRFNQDNDNWTGKALIGNKAAIDQARAAGRGVLMLVWEDDQGSKCAFQTSSATKRKIFQFLDLAGAAVSIGWGTCAATDQCKKGPPPWLFWLGFGVAAISEYILGNDDDQIGAVALPPGANPFTLPAPILYRASSTSGIQNRGSVSFVALP